MHTLLVNANKIGLRLTFTNAPREHTTGIIALSLGRTSNYVVIPPYRKTTYRLMCQADCTTVMFNLGK